jgi:hypothetical protein
MCCTESDLNNFIVLILEQVRQYTVRTDTPVAFRHLSVQPAVHYSSALAPLAVEPIVQHNIW